MRSSSSIFVDSRPTWSYISFASENYAACEVFDTLELPEILRTSLALSYRREALAEPRNGNPMFEKLVQGFYAQ